MDEKTYLEKVQAFWFAYERSTQMFYNRLEIHSFGRWIKDKGRKYS